MIFKKNCRLIKQINYAKQDYAYVRQRGGGYNYVGY